MDDDVVRKNKELIEKYPFILPRNRLTGKVSQSYDWTHTEYDFAEIPDGWRTKFLMNMFDEIRKSLIKEEKLRTGSDADKKKFAKYYCGDYDEKNCDLLHTFRILDIKEKFGQLRFYSNFSTKGVSKIISKYTKISERTCCMCGNDATLVSTGYVLPYCDKCAEKWKKYNSYINIEEWLK